MSIMRMVRGSGGGGIAPPPIALGAFLWFNADANVTAAASRVSSWVDVISGVDAVQVTTTQQPLYLPSSPSVGNRAAVEFDNTRPDVLTGVYTGATQAGVSSGVAYFAVKPTVGTQCPFTIISSSTVSFQRLRFSGTPQTQVRDDVGATTTAGLADGSQASFMTNATDAANNSIYVQGGTASAAAPGLTFSDGQVRLGAVNGAGTLAFSGQIRHGVAFRRVLGAAEAAVLNAWLLSEVS